MVIPRKKLSLLDTLVSLPVDPSGMMRHLLQERRVPPYLILAPVSTLMVLVAPTLWYQHRFQTHLALPQVFAATALTTVMTLLCFSFFMSVLFKLLLLDVSMFKIIAAVLYSMAGLIPFMLAYYLGNYLASGSLTILRFLSTGRIDSEDWFVGLFPTCAKVALSFSFFLFIQAIRSITNSKMLSAVSMAALGIPVLIGSFAVSLTISDAIFKDSGIEVYRFFVDLLEPRH